MKKKSGLPIEAERQKIMEAIRQNKVTIIEGETGCGKTTQIPQYILDQKLQNNDNRKILLTQPRRVAAISISNRIGYQLSQRNLDRSLVGFKIGMKESKDLKMALIEVVTTGLFLQSVVKLDTLFQKYSHVIIDEAHQRHLDSDFALVLLKLLLMADSSHECPKKQYSRTGRIVIMSATINTKLFADYFGLNKAGEFIDHYSYNLFRLNNRRRDYREREGAKKEVQLEKVHEPAPVINIKAGRKYSIEVRFIEHYQTDYDGRFNQHCPKFDQRVLEFALKKVFPEVSKYNTILVFAPGLYEIMKVRDSLIKAKFYQPWQIVELHSHLTQFNYPKLDAKGRKVIISTNIAESSLTIPDCEVVLDFCLTKAVNYNSEDSSQQLVLDWASQASIKQRTGRVGRVCDGLVIRLISQEFYNKLSPYQRPEMERCSIEKLVLRSLKLAYHTKEDKGEQLFKKPKLVLLNALSPPNLQQIEAATLKLFYMGALEIKDEEESDDQQDNGDQQLVKEQIPEITGLGLYLCDMPCDIRVSLMLRLAAYLSVLQPVLSIAALLHSKKGIFLHRQNRSEEDFLVTMANYDHGHLNDMIMQADIFEHWIQQFFGTHEYKPEEGTSAEEQAYQKNQFLKNEKNKAQHFAQSRPSKDEVEFCSLRCISVERLREALVIRCDICLRLHQMLNMQRRTISRDQKVKLVRICVLAGMLDRVYSVHFNEVQKFVGQFCPQNEVRLTRKEKFSQQQRKYYTKEIDKFYKHYKTAPKVKFIENSILLQLETEALVATLLFQQRRFKDKDIYDEESFAFLLSSCNIQYRWRAIMADMLTQERADVSYESINYRLPKMTEAGYMTAGETIRGERGGGIRLSMTGYYSEVQLIFYSLVFSSKIKFRADPIGLFVEKLKFGKNWIKLPFYYVDEHHQLVLEMRALLEKNVECSKQFLVLHQKLLGLKREIVRPAEKLFFSYMSRNKQAPKKEKKSRNWGIEDKPRCQIRSESTLREFKEQYREFNRDKVKLLLEIRNKKQLLNVKENSAICRRCHEVGRLVVIVRQIRLIELGDKIGIDYNHYEDQLVQKGDSSRFDCPHGHHLFSRVELDSSEEGTDYLVLEGDPLYLLRPGGQVIYDVLQYKQSDQKENEQAYRALMRRPDPCLICDLQFQSGKDLLEHLATKKHRDQLAEVDKTVQQIDWD